MTALLLKETRALAPWWGGAAALLLVATLGALFDETLLLEPLGSRYDYAMGAPLYPWMYALLLGHGLVAHEVVHGQVQFLDGLPTTRRQVFLAKVVAGALPCIALLLGSAAVDVWLERVAAPPFAGSGLRAIGLGHLAASATLWFALGLGMLLSWLRGLALGAVVALLFVGLFLGEMFPAWAAWIPLPDADYGVLSYTKRTAVLDLRPAALWAIVGTGCMAVSGLLFLGPGAQVLDASAWAGRALRTVAIGLVALFVLVAAAHGMGDIASFLSGASAIRTRQVGTLRVLYDANDEDHILETTAALPDQLARVAALLGHEGPLPALDVEFLGAARNHGGVFTGGKVRVRKRAESFVVVHELAHVVAHLVSGDHGMHDDHHLRFFQEGLANWVAAEVTGGSQLPPQVGWLHEMGQARFDLLVEDHLFQAEQDLAQAYELGQVWIDGLIEVGGPDVLGCTLRAVGQRAEGAKAGLALWYQVAADCDVALDDVLDAWRARLERSAEAIEAVPRLVASRDIEPDGRAVALRVTEAAGFEQTCRFRDHAGVEAHQLYHRDVDDGVCRIPRDWLAGPSFDYQLGFAPPGTRAWVFHPWVRDVPLD